MAGHYSPKQFIRQVPNAQLREFFDRRGELSDFSWDKLGEIDADPIFEAWQSLPDASRNDVERWFRAISELATPAGLRTTIEEGQFHGLDLAVSLGGMKGLHEKIFSVYLKHEKVFLAAGRLNRADHLNGRYWRRRSLPAKTPDLSHPTRKLLAQAISQYYRENQGRGEHCDIEVYLRREKLHYFFAYTADYADTVIVYTDEGSLARQLQKAAFEVIFAYNEASGTLDVFVQGDKKIRRAMEEMFARHVLKEELPAEDPKRPPYQLDALRRPEFDFPTNPQDKITETRVKLLRLSIVGPGFGRITFESDSWKKRGDIHDLIGKYLNHHSASGVTMNVTHAMMQVTFETADGPQIFPFRITHPDSCSLKDEPEHLIIKEYLRRWGIATEG
jgi:hypothetical protein